MFLSSRPRASPLTRVFQISIIFFFWTTTLQYLKCTVNVSMSEPDGKTGDKVDTLQLVTFPSSGRIFYHFNKLLRELSSAMLIHLRLVIYHFVSRAYHKSNLFVSRQLTSVDTTKYPYLKPNTKQLTSWNPCMYKIVHTIYLVYVSITIQRQCDQSLQDPSLLHVTQSY